jgi:hypothetical protein
LKVIFKIRYLDHGATQGNRHHHHHEVVVEDVKEIVNEKIKRGIEKNIDDQEAVVIHHPLSMSHQRRHRQEEELK